MFVDRYVVLKIDTQNMPNGQALLDRFCKSQSGGIPWMVILDPDGQPLISSDGPDGNIGCPIMPNEVEYFMTMIRQTNSTASEDQLDRIKSAIETNAQRFRRT